MLKFKEYIKEEMLIVEAEELLTEAKDDKTKVGGASNNTKGVLHELLVGHHLQGGKHMETHHLIHPDTGKRESPIEAHDRLKASIHPDDYKKINAKAKSAAEDIKKQVEAGGHKIGHVHHTSKPGDTEKETGVKATQKQDSSDIYVTTKHPKTGKEQKHGISLKVTDKSSKNIPCSSLGMESSGPKAIALYKAHQNKIKDNNPTLVDVKKENHHKEIADARKEWATKNPESHKKIKAENAKLLTNVALEHAVHLQKQLKNGNHEHVINHIRDVLGAHSTPAAQSGKATFRKHTTYVTAKGAQHHTINPGESHEHILKDHQNISVVHNGGGTVHFYHTDPKTGIKKKFASQAHKFDSQSDPLSTLKSAGRAT